MIYINLKRTDRAPVIASTYHIQESIQDSSYITHRKLSFLTLQSFIIVDLLQLNNVCYIGTLDGLHPITHKLRCLLLTEV